MGLETGRRWLAPGGAVAAMENGTIRHQVAEGFIVICAGGGGSPVQVLPDGAIRGVEAVIDKDRSSALLAAETGADALLLLSDVDGVYEAFGTPAARRLNRLAAAEIKGLGLDPGSMGPKAAAAGDFARATGGLAVIGAMDDAAAMLAGEAGTRIVP
jgi:carbamate kinase